MSMTLNERNPNVDIIPLGSRASGVTVTVPGLYFRKHSKIKNVYFADRSGLSASTSNYQTITLQDNSSTPVVYATSFTASAAAVLANTPSPLVLASQSDDSSQAVSQEEDVPAGTQLNVKAVGAGTAILTDSVVIVEWYPL